MAAKPGSQADYLKKYLSGGGDDKNKKIKKKKKVPVKQLPSFKIVDADEEAKATSNKIVDDVDDDPVVVVVPEKKQERQYVKEDDGSGWVTVDDIPTPKFAPKVERDDSSPPRRGRVDADNSPPRRGRVDTDNSPPRRGRVDADNSPPRRGRVDSSPPRRGRVDTDNSPPRRGRVADNSPPRRGRVDTDNSPPRRGRADADSSPPRKRAADTDRDGPSKKPAFMSSGALAGLHKGETIRKQAEEKMRIEKERLSKLDAKTLGKDEDTVFRDRRGRRLQGLEEFLRQQDGKFTATEEDDMEWGKGKVQKQQRKDEADLIKEEANKPFARRADDPELDAHFKDINRWGDPMAGLVRKKSRTPAKPVYKGPPGPANRFSIAPGYRWDGIDRGNGFEREYFKAQAHKQANKEEAYLWSVEDM